MTTTKSTHVRSGKQKEPNILRRAALPAKMRLFPFVLKMRLPTASLRCLPRLLVIGAQRAGSTSMHNHLRQHPDLIPCLGNEIQYFSDHYQRGEYWYRAHFPLKATMEIRSGLSGRECLAFESSTSYLHNPLVPERVREDLPRVRILALLRNPVDRAYSNYMMEFKDGNEPLSFEEALDTEEERLAGEKPGVGYYGKYAYALKGRYIEHIRRWRKFFSPEEFLVLGSENFFKEPEKTLEEVCRFLNITPHSFDCSTIWNRQSYPAPIKPETRKRLEALFVPYNEELADFTNGRIRW